MLTLQTETDKDTGEPKDELTEYAKQQLQLVGSHRTRVSEILWTRDSKVYDAIREGLIKANEHAISTAQRVMQSNVMIIITTYNNLFARFKNFPFCPGIFPFLVGSWVRTLLTTTVTIISSILTTKVPR